MTHAHVRGNDSPRPSAGEIRRALDGELSATARAGYTLLLLTSLSASIVIGTLLATEPGLPVRTRLAFTVLTGMGLAWTALAAWVLTRRRVLFVPHRVIAARMAVGFSALFALGALVVGPQWITGWYWALALAVSMLAVAIVLLVNAGRRFRELSARREQLEHALARQEGRR
jgi:hypothetical protein